MLTRIIQKFLQTKNVDERFEERIKDAKTMGAFTEIVAEAGYELTNEEFNRCLSELLKEELSDDELEQVAGGSRPRNYHPDRSHSM